MQSSLIYLKFFLSPKISPDFPFCIADLMSSEEHCHRTTNTSETCCVTQSSFLSQGGSQFDGLLEANTQCAMLKRNIVCTPEDTDSTGRIA